MPIRPTTAPAATAAAPPTPSATGAEPRHPTIAGLAPQASVPVGRTWFRAVAAMAPLAALIVYLVFAVRAGLPALGAASALLVIIATQLLPGVVVWRCIRPRCGSWVEDLVMGFAVGTAIAVASQAVAGALQARWVGAVAGPLAAVGLLLWPRCRERVRSADTSPLPLGWGPAVALVTLLQLVPTQGFYRTVPLSWPSGFRSTYVDIPFHQALAAQLAHRGPLEMPYVLGERLQYHWFSHAWVAQVSSVSGLSLDATLIRFLPSVITVSAIVAVAIAAVRVSGRAWAGPVAALLAVAAGDLDVYGGVRPGALVSHLSPSTSLSVPIIAALLVLLVMRWRNLTRPGSAVLLAVLAFTAAGMKGSALPVVVAGAALAAAAAVLTQHPTRRRIFLDMGLLTGVFLVAMVVIFRGNAQGMTLDPVGAAGTFARHLGLDPAHADTGTFAASGLAMLTFVAALARATGLAALMAEREGRRDPGVWLLLGAGLAGAGAVVLFSHGGQSQWYFLRSAGPALAIGSAAGLLAILDRAGARARELLFGGILLGLVGVRLPALVLGPVRALDDDTEALQTALLSLAAFAALVGFGALALAWTGGRQRHSFKRTAVGLAIIAVLSAATVPVLGVLSRPTLPANASPVEPEERFAMSADQIEAARWIRDHSNADDVVMTNRHCSAPNWQNCDSRRFHLAAYSERRVLVEGWAYTESWAATPPVEHGAVYKPFWEPRRLELNDAFFERPSAAMADRLYEQGVRWAFVDKTVDDAAALGEHAELRLDTEWASVYELRPPPSTARGTFREAVERRSRT